MLVSALLTSDAASIFYYESFTIILLKCEMMRIKKKKNPSKVGMSSCCQTMASSGPGAPGRHQHASPLEFPTLQQRGQGSRGPGTQEPSSFAELIRFSLS